MEHPDKFPGVLVDIAVLVIAYLSAKSGIIPGGVLVGVICSMVSARAVLAHKRPGGPTLPGGSAAVALLLAVGVAIWSGMGKTASTT